MAIYVAVDCDRDECTEGWSSDYLSANDTSSVKGAAEYLTNMEAWVTSDDGEKIFCSHSCMEMVL